MELFFVEPLREGVLPLSEEESVHLRSVLRLGVGARVMLTDGAGRMAEGVVLDAAARAVVVEMGAPQFRARTLAEQSRVLVAPPKQTERLEWIVEKAVELGVGAIQWVESSRCERGRVNIDRLTRVARAAMKQSLGCYLPRIDPLTPLPKCLAEHYAGSARTELRAVAHIEEGVSPFPSLAQRLAEAGAMRPLSLAIGPEGGFTPEEVNLLREHGFLCVSLGAKRLRVETAVLAGLALFSQWPEG